MTVNDLSNTIYFVIDGDPIPGSALGVNEAKASLVRPSLGPNLVFEASRPAVIISIEPQLEPIPVYEHFGQPLSPRQEEVLLLSFDGSSIPQIGRRLGIATQTVKNHLVNAEHKLGAASKSDALVISVASGKIDLGRVHPGEFEPSRLESLTSRQREIFSALVENNGYIPYKELAGRLGIKEQTLKNIALRIYRKLGIHSREQALGAYMKTLLTT